MGPARVPRTRPALCTPGQSETNDCFVCAAAMAFTPFLADIGETRVNSSHFMKQSGQVARNS